MTRGVTLLELMVATLALGLVLAISGVALRALAPSPTAQLIQQLEAVRLDAIRSGRPRAWQNDGAVVRFLPDGSSSGGRVTSGGATIVIDPVTGAIRETR